MILSVLLTYIAGGSIFLLSKQAKHLNVFEILGLGFGVGLSLFVMESIVTSLLFHTISILFPIITSVLLVGYLAWKHMKKKGESFFPLWKENFRSIYHDVKHFGLLRKVGKSIEMV
jgi:uncharacterized protein YacL